MNSMENRGIFVREILLFFPKNNIEAWIRFLEILFKGLGYHPMSCNPNRDCRVWDHTGSRLLLHRKMAGFQTVGRIPTVAYLASNGIHRASVRLTNIKATLMLFRGNKAIGKGNQTLDQSILGYCRILHQKAQLFWRKKDGECLNKKWTGFASCFTRKLWNDIWEDSQKNVDQISNFFHRF